MRIHLTDYASAILRANESDYRHLINDFVVLEDCVMPKRDPIKAIDKDYTGRR